MTGDPPRRPRRASLDVILMVGAMLLIAGFVALIVLHDAGVRWARDLIDRVGKPAWVYWLQGGALLLLLAATRARTRAQPRAQHLPWRPRRASMDVILIVAAILLIAAFVALIVLATSEWRPANYVLDLVVTPPFAAIWHTTALVLVAAAIIVRVRRG